MLPHNSIYVAGHTGLVGSAVVRHLKDAGYNNLILRTRNELDLRNQAAVNDFFNKQRPEYVFLAAAYVGSIYANQTEPANFIYNNLAIQTNTINAAYHCGSVYKFVFLGSSCAYPKFAGQPIQEKSLLSGPLEPTSEWYATAKIAGIKLAQAFRKQNGFNIICLMPTNVYGPNDSYSAHTSYVIPALIRKFHFAKVNDQNNVRVWGTGASQREFLHSDDLASACCYLMHHYDENEIINVGSGEEITIARLAWVIKEIVGFYGDVEFNSAMHDGVPRRLLDSSRLRLLGWYPTIPLRYGIEQTYKAYLANLG